MHVRCSFTSLNSFAGSRLQVCDERIKIFARFSSTHVSQRHGRQFRRSTTHHDVHLAPALALGTKENAAAAMVMLIMMLVCHGHTAKWKESSGGLCWRDWAHQCRSRERGRGEKHEDWMSTVLAWMDLIRAHEMSSRTCATQGRWVWGWVDTAPSAALPPPCGLLVCLLGVHRVVHTANHPTASPAPATRPG